MIITWLRDSMRILFTQMSLKTVTNITEPRICSFCLHQINVVEKLHTSNRSKKLFVTLMDMQIFIVSNEFLVFCVNINSYFHQPSIFEHIRG